MRKTSRRTFAATITAVGATLPFVTPDLLGQTAPTPSPAPAPPQPEPSPLAGAMTGVVKAEHGQFLSDEEMERIGKDFQESIPGLKRLRDVKLVNADEPDVSFSSLAKRW
jgi:hypothetical protein